jgi:pyridoxal phosphate enzyme (YggS family)
MSINLEAYHKLSELTSKHMALLVAVSKTKPAEDILELYELGHRDFGENYVQELLKKQAELPQDIRWHFIGHLQSNKVKLIAPFVHMIHGVDSLKLLQEIDKVGGKINRKITCLLQVHIAKEETKFGFDEGEVNALASSYFIDQQFQHLELAGLMGMASFTSDLFQIEGEFQKLKSIFDDIKSISSDNTSRFNVLSMGMSGDYELALQHGSTLIRIGSMLFGSRV